MMERLRHRHWQLSGRPFADAYREGCKKRPADGIRPKSDRKRCIGPIQAGERNICGSTPNDHPLNL
ncbi:hypothetical protein RGR602_PC01807 (plasmid) [Rhizobium gallicum bv. gallicum R602sp]|uniref:Uncharacterized protein n=1 Tax=Rhizobium gallicum bv. gallicum R602sp TaxID=1041138 RepID=A0A0B4XFF0_9HYPH|nr:hypothetical protein RGR602_PC01807 [Rhizobium gallicum bv. gallicum R602sp]